MFDESAFLGDYHALSALLDSADAAAAAAAKAGRQDDSKPSTSATPGGVGPQELLPVTVPAPTGRGKSSDIWDAAAVPDAADLPDVDDGRQQPKYTFLYKQAVGTQDTYLGMSHKDPSTTCCEQLVVRVDMPAANNIKDVDLDVQPTYLRLQSPQYKLTLHLPHKVDDQRGRATWDAKQHILSVTLPILRSEEDLLLP